MQCFPLDCVYNHMRLLCMDVHCLCPCARLDVFCAFVWGGNHNIHIMSWFRRCYLSKRGCVADRGLHWLAVRVMRSPCWLAQRSGLKGEHSVCVCRCRRGNKCWVWCSSSSCSASDPHTHCSSSDLYTPNYTRAASCSIRSNIPYIETINTNTEQTGTSKVYQLCLFRKCGKSFCH